MNQFNPFSLENKTILITGASSGIGKATAIECSKAGANLIITGRDEIRLLNTLESLATGNHKYLVIDLNNGDELLNLISETPQLDGVVLCAGVNEVLPLQFLSRKKIDKIFEINFFSQVELLRLLIKKKKFNTNASVVTMSSIGGTKVFTPGSAAYGASKAALLSWMKTAAKELAPKFRINCICPGQINTPMNENSGITDEEYEKYRESIPMKRFGEASEIAYSTIYLLSNATQWMTGSVIVIDGGTTLS